MMAENKFIMKMERPAVRWEDATPCGNGTIGAMMYSHITRETILFNHEDLWLPIFRQPKTPHMAQYLPEYRRLLDEGKCHEADRYWREALKKEGWPDFVYTNPGHPAFDLRVKQEFNALFSEYERTLDMSSGEARVAWKIGETAYERKMFVSRAENMAVILFCTDRAGGVNAELGLKEHGFAPGIYPVKLSKEELPISFVKKAEADCLRFEGSYPDGSGYAGTAKLLIPDGEMKIREDTIEIKNASQLLVLVKLDKGSEPGKIQHDFPKNPEYQTLLDAHKKLHSELFLRISLDLNAKDRGDTNQQLLYKAFRGKIPTALYERLFYYGRYLFLSSAGGKLPPNLQGIWNGEYLPPWSCAYTLDENIQMMHWQVMPGNLPELMEPYFRFVERAVPQWEENAKNFYGCDGILAPISQADHAALCENMPYLMLTCVAGWLVKEFYTYYLYTKDEVFLLERALPLLEKAAQFYIDFSCTAETGERVLSPSMSPENNPVVEEKDYPPDPWLRASVNPTIDIAIFKELLQTLCTIYRQYDLKPEKREAFLKILSELPDYRINDDGALREWIHEKYGDHYRHRHISHLYPVFPGNEITEQSDPALREACKQAMRKKTESGMEAMTCWGYIHMAHIFHCLHQPEEALLCLEYAVKGCVGENFLMYINSMYCMGIAESYSEENTYNKPIYQMDANTGVTSLITQMLVDSCPDHITVLGSLPQEWDIGSVEGVQCMGQIEASVRWNLTAREITLELCSKENQTVRLAFPDWVCRISGAETVQCGKYTVLCVEKDKPIKLRCLGNE